MATGNEPNANDSSTNVSWTSPNGKPAPPTVSEPPTSATSTHRYPPPTEPAIDVTPDPFLPANTHALPRLDEQARPPPAELGVTVRLGLACRLRPPARHRADL